MRDEFNYGGKEFKYSFEFPPHFDFGCDFGIVYSEYQIIDLKNCKTKQEFKEKQKIILNAPIFKTNAEDWTLKFKPYSKRTKKQVDDMVLKFCNSIKKAKPVKQEIIWQ